MGKNTTKVGIVGCGGISAIYCKAGQTFEILEVAAVSDIEMDRAKAKAKEFGIPKACTVDELMADPEIEIVVNLTIPAAHAEVGMAAIEAGKHVHGEKPLAVTREDGLRLLEAADAKGLRVGSAPDTFLGGGIQTCRKLIDDGWIGEPIGATAFMTSRGTETWHANPEFFYKPGAGPMFDMGPYYLTALISLLGPVKSVAGMAKISFPERLVTSQPHAGLRIQVEVPTHVTSVLEFESGPTAMLMTSFDVCASQLPRIEIYGSEATLAVPDPNTFGGPVRIRRFGENEWSDVPLSHGYAENSRGLGAADIAYAVQSGRVHRCNGRMAYHVLDLMHACAYDAPQQGKQIAIESTCDQPAPLPLGLRPGTLDA